MCQIAPSPAIASRMNGAGHICASAVIATPMARKINITCPLTQSHRDTEFGSQTLQPNGAVDRVGRLAANAREHKNVKYKKLGVLALLVFHVLVFSRRAVRRDVDGCHGAH